MTSWSLRDAVKVFPGVRALDGVSLTVEGGEIRALVGENGCGKSTLIKLFAGVHAPDGGSVVRDGEPIDLPTPRDARRAGVATIYQERSLVGSLSVAENIVVGDYPARRGFVDRARARERAVAALEMLDIDIDLDTRVEELSVADQQIVEIAKAVSGNSTLLILDEPTTALSVAEVERLHALVDRLAATGHAILYVSHRLEELVGVAHSVTVMRDGRVVREFHDEVPQVAEIVEAMVGRSVSHFYARDSHARSEERLRLEGVSTDAARDVDLVVHRGEVLGLAGAVGAGRTEIARAIFGVDQVTSGRILLDGQDITRSRPRTAIRQGLGYVPESRKSEALFFNLRASQNMSVARLSRIVSRGWLSLRTERAIGTDLTERFRISSHAEQVSIEQLSGGNQQKLVLARWVFAGSEVLILDEPTQGIDVGAKQEVYRIIQELTAQGIAVLLISSDLPELLAMSDRLAIVRHRTVTRVVDAAGLTELQLIDAMSGVSSESEQDR